MTIAFTGHRPARLGNDYDLTSPLIMLIRDEIVRSIGPYLSQENNITFITGMALGIDTLAARIAIDLDIPFIAAIPCRGQHSKWLSKSVVEYMNLLTKAEYVYLCDTGEKFLSNEPSAFYQWLKPDGSYTAKKMDDRNRWMVDQLTEPEDLLIAVWDNSPGGTKNCHDYAVKQGKQIIVINPKNIIA